MPAFNTNTSIDKRFNTACSKPCRLLEYFLYLLLLNKKEANVIHTLHNLDAF